jgi:hypothetical protein
VQRLHESEQHKLLSTSLSYILHVWLSLHVRWRLPTPWHRREWVEICGCGSHVRLSRGKPREGRTHPGFCMVLLRTCLVAPKKLLELEKNKIVIRRCCGLCDFSTKDGRQSLVSAKWEGPHPSATIDGKKLCPMSLEQVIVKLICSNWTDATYKWLVHSDLVTYVFLFI